MRNILRLFAAVALLAVAAHSQLQHFSKTQDEEELRSIESKTAECEQRNDSSIMNFLADDWVFLGTKVLTKSEFVANVKQNFVTHDNGPSPYTVEKQKVRVDLFGDTAVVTYIKRYRQTPDTTKFFDEGTTDVFTREPKGWQLRLTKVYPVRVESESN